MSRRLLALLFFFFLSKGPANAHIGSPDVFYEGLVGSYPALITIRMPAVVPGRAQISVRVQAEHPVEVTPLYSRTAVKNAPPADIGLLVPGERNLYSGDLWLMRFGAYSIEIRINGEAGQGTVQIPVNSVAIHQMPLPPYLGKLLLLLGAILIFGGVAIVGVSASESTLAPGVLPGKIERRKGLKASLVMALIFVAMLVGGRKWWNAEETNFRRNLREGAWPDVAAEVRVEGSQRILGLAIGQQTFRPNDAIDLIPDHGKLLHLFLVREPGRDVFAHLHPVRKDGKTFEVALPPLPEGRYELFCDMTFGAGSGLSSTATNSVQLPAIPSMATGAVFLKPDPDDSWVEGSANAAPTNTTGDSIYTTSDGEQVLWKSHPLLRVKQDAALKFEVKNSAGQPVELELYMGMISHAAVLRSDGRVFAHLHPSGNFSMAAQSFFETKIARESSGESGTAMPAEMDHSKMNHGFDSNIGASSISIPYEFPSPGDYCIWIQFKTGGRVSTAVFDTTVAQ